MIFCAILRQRRHDNAVKPTSRVSILLGGFKRQMNRSLHSRSSHRCATKQKITAANPNLSRIAESFHRIDDNQRITVADRILHRVSDVSVFQRSQRAAVVHLVASLSEIILSEIDVDSKYSRSDTDQQKNDHCQIPYSPMESPRPAARTQSLFFIQRSTALLR